MIPTAYIQAWSATVPWPDPHQVEQYLVICRALCDIFNDPRLADRLAFRGGTAIHKLLFRKPLRYSEDIDLVQVHVEQIGPTVDAVRRALSWLGPCRRKAAAHSIHLVFRLVQLSLDPMKIVASLDHYLAHDGIQITRANAEERMLAKLTRSLTDDIAPLLAADVVYGAAEAQAAFERVWFRLITRLSGARWHRSDSVIEELRATTMSRLLRDARA